MPPVKGHKQQRGNRRRQEIIDASLKLFCNNGFAATSLAAIADRVGISAPTILHHFDSKESLLLAVITEMDAKHRPTWEELTEVGGVAALRRLPEMAADLMEDEDLTRLLVVLGAENLHPEGLVHDYFVRRYRTARRWLAGLIRSGQKRGEIDGGVDADVKAALIMAAQNGLLTQALLDPRRVSFDAAYRDFIETLVRDIKAGS